MPNWMGRYDCFWVMPMGVNAAIQPKTKARMGGINVCGKNQRMQFLVETVMRYIVSFHRLNGIMLGNAVAGCKKG